MPLSKIRVAIIGVGNCASSLVQGIQCYKDTGNLTGVRNNKIGPFAISDIEFVLGIDIDKRKVGTDLATAIFQEPNNTTVIHPVEPTMGVDVVMGNPLDGVAHHTKNLDESHRILLSDQRPCSMADMVSSFRENKADVVLNYLPVGSNTACEFYFEAALQAGCTVVNCVPFLAASDLDTRNRFSAKGLFILGDDIKSQVGATIIHRELLRTLKARGVEIDRSYQISVGGNTDFSNMLDRTRIKTKKVTKEFPIDSVVGDSNFSRVITPADYIPWMKDRKTCFLRVEGRNFGGQEFDIEVRLSVEDSPNSAGSVIDLIRWAAIARLTKDQSIADLASAVFCKRPFRDLDEAEATAKLNEIQTSN